MEKLTSKKPSKPKHALPAGPGRPKGVPNKTTTDVRAAIAELMQTTAPKMAGWLERVAEDDPGRAIDLALKAAEYHIPKLARTEHVGEGGGPVQHAVVERRIVHAPD